MGTITASLPDRMIQSIIVMRRNPEEFTFLRMSRCKFCYKTVAYDIGHPLNPTNAGSWCPTHGWLAFDSPKIRPIGDEYIPKKKKRVKVL